MRKIFALIVFALPCLFFASPAQAVCGLLVTGDAACEGNFGLRVTVDGSCDAYVQSDHPTDEKTFTARFCLNPGLLPLTGSNSIRFLIGSTTGCCQQVIGFISRSAGTGNYRLIFWVRNDSGGFQLGAATFLTSGTTPITASVEIVWSAATAPGADNGSIFVSVNGGTPSGRSDLDNDTLEVDTVRVGTFVGGNPSGVIGSYDFDAYESFR